MDSTNNKFSRDMEESSVGFISAKVYWDSGTLMLSEIELDIL